MIKYVELTAPNASAFRQAKILSIECQEGDQIKEGDTLFKVQSGSHQINLPATKAGRIVEMIATVKENITISTALLLLETKVVDSTVSKPIVKGVDNAESEKTELTKQTNNSLDEVLIKKPVIEKTNTKKNKKVTKKQHQQQSLDLMAQGPKSSPNDESEATLTTNDSAAHKQEEVVLTKTVTPPNPVVKNTQKASPTMSSSSKSSSSIIEITVPDIGADSAKVIEIFVDVGDSVSAEDPLITLESDKASMDVPSPHNGVIKSIAVSVDQDVSEGTIIVELEAYEQSSGATNSVETKQEEFAPKTQEADNEPKAEQGSSASEIVNVIIPDIGGDSAKVIEILVNVGDTVEVEDPLVSLESDKASMDVPSSANGIIKSIEIAMDQDVSEGTVVVTLETVEAKDSTSPSSESPSEPVKSEAPKQEAPKVEPTPVKPEPAVAPAKDTNEKSHASPSIRRFARELGVELSQLPGSGRKGRITKDDVKNYVKGALSNTSTAASSPAASSGSGIPAVPAQDFTKFGDIDVQPLNKIKKLTASNLHRSWLNVPHVTHNDESNINDLEAFRKQLNAEYAKTKQDIKLSPLAFIVKAMVNALQRYPQFNSSLEPGGENLIYKKYFNIGIAVETPNGLVVPVIKDADKKSVAEIATEMGELAKKARDKKLTMNDMSGACITISSLGGIGGTGFTPIVNAPEVAILGVSRSKVQPVWNGSEFEPGMILPLSLSYDHRVIDGAEAARFTRHIAALLEDIRRLTV